MPQLAAMDLPLDQTLILVQPGLLLPWSLRLLLLLLLLLLLRSHASETWLWAHWWWRDIERTHA
jgi:hypothetical protein